MLTVTISGQNSPIRSALGGRIIRSIGVEESWSEAEVRRHHEQLEYDGKTTLPRASYGDVAIELNDQPVPSVGPLTSVGHLLPGDVLRLRGDFLSFAANGQPVIFEKVSGDTADVQMIVVTPPFGFGRGCVSPERLEFIGRPDGDGYFPWSHSENPAPGHTISVKRPDVPDAVRYSDDMRWQLFPTNRVHPIKILRRGREETKPLDLSLIGKVGPDSDYSEVFTLSDFENPKAAIPADRAAADAVRDAHAALLTALEEARRIGLFATIQGNPSVDWNYAAPVITQVL